MPIYIIDSSLVRFLTLFCIRRKKKWEILQTNAERRCFLFGKLDTFVNVPQDTAGFDDVFALAQTGELDGRELKKYINSMLDEYTVYTTTEYARQDAIKNIAKNLLAEDCKIEFISRVTGLSPDAIQALQTQQ